MYFAYHKNVITFGTTISEAGLYNSFNFILTLWEEGGTVLSNQMSFKLVP
jgi:hypothetical protein